MSEAYIAKVSMPYPDMWRLEEAAELYGATLSEYMYSVAMTAAGFRPTEYQESVALLHKAGFSVKQIGARLNMTNSAVKHRIKYLGLKPVARAA